MSIVKIFSGAIGVNNKIQPQRLHYDPESGVSALEWAENVFIDPTGAIVARRGYEKQEDGVFHSLYPGKDWGLVVKDRDNDSALYKVVVSDSGNVSLEGIRSGMAKGRKLDYCFANGFIFYANGYENGMVTPDGVSVPWKENQWFNEQTIVGFTAPPPAEHLAYNAGRIFFSTENVLNYTEFGMLGLYDPARNGEQFNGRIRAIIPAPDGLYVSTNMAIYFLAGLNPKKWTSRQVLGYPALEWGVGREPVKPNLFGLEPGYPAYVAATVNGPVIFLAGGQVYNLIEKNIKLPDCPQTGALAVFDETLIIQTGE